MIDCKNCRVQKNWNYRYKFGSHQHLNSTRNPDIREEKQRDTTGPNRCRVAHDEGEGKLRAEKREINIV